MESNCFRLIGTVNSEMLGSSGQPDLLRVRAQFIHIKNDNISYAGCHTAGCAKKVILQDTDEWTCEKCSKSFPNPEYK